MENVLRGTFSLPEKFYTLKKSRNQGNIFTFSFSVNPGTICCLCAFSLLSTTVSQKKGTTIFVVFICINPEVNRL